MSAQRHCLLHLSRSFFLLFLLFFAFSVVLPAAHADSLKNVPVKAPTNVLAEYSTNTILQSIFSKAACSSQYCCGNILLYTSGSTYSCTTNPSCKYANKYDCTKFNNQCADSSNQYYSCSCSSNNCQCYTRKCAGGCSGSTCCSGCSTNCNSQDGRYCKSSTESVYRDYSCSCSSCTYTESGGTSCANGCNSATGNCNSAPACTESYANIRYLSVSPSTVAPGGTLTVTYQVYGTQYSTETQTIFTDGNQGDCYDNAVSCGSWTGTYTRSVTASSTPGSHTLRVKVYGGGSRACGYQDNYQEVSYTVQGCSENCAARNGYYCTNSNQYSEYRNYYCSGSSCTYTPSQQTCCSNGCNSSGMCAPNPTLDITSVTPVAGPYNLENTYAVTIGYTANFNGYVNFAVDLIKGTTYDKNCYKLHCGAPSLDSECYSGCAGGNLKNMYVYSGGSRTLTVYITLPNGYINGHSDDFSIAVGAWRTSFTDQYDVFYDGSREVSCHRGNNGGYDFLSGSCIGDLNEGDCDSNSDCISGYCKNDVGSSYGWNSDVDVCQLDCSSYNQCISTTHLHKYASYSISGQSCSVQGFDKPTNYMDCSGTTKYLKVYENCDPTQLGFPWHAESQFNCENQNTHITKDYCSGNVLRRQINNTLFTCGSGACVKSSSSNVQDDVLQDCAALSGWQCTNSNTRQYKNYFCSSSLVDCDFTYTQTENCRFGCNSATATCNKIDINDVTSPTSARLNTDIVVTPQTQSYGIADNVIYTVELKKGVSPSCKKLWCANPSLDTECGGCAAGSLYPPRYIYANTINQTDLPIALPATGEIGTYQLIVSVYKAAGNNPDYSNLYDTFTKTIEIKSICDGVVCPAKCTGDVLSTGSCNQTNGGCDYANVTCSDMDGWTCNSNNAEERDYYCSAGNCAFSVTQQENCTFGCYAPAAACKNVSITDLKITSITDTELGLDVFYDSIGIDGNYPLTFEIANHSTFGTVCYNQTYDCNCRWYMPPCPPHMLCIQIMQWICDNCTQQLCNGTGMFYSQTFNISVANGGHSVSLNVPLPSNITEDQYVGIVSIWQTLKTLLFDSVNFDFDIIFGTFSNTSPLGFIPMPGNSGTGSGSGSNNLSIIVGVATALGTAAIAIVYSFTRGSSTQSSVRQLAKSIDEIQKAFYTELPPARLSFSELLANTKAYVGNFFETQSEKFKDYFGKPPAPPEDEPWHEPADIPGGIEDGTFVGYESIIPQSYLDALEEFQNSLDAEKAKDAQDFLARIAALDYNALKNMNEYSRIWYFQHATMYGLTDVAAIFGSRASLNAYMDAVKPPEQQPEIPPAPAWYGIPGIGNTAYLIDVITGKRPLGDLINVLAPYNTLTAIWNYVIPADTRNMLVNIGDGLKKALDDAWAWIQENPLQFLAAVAVLIIGAIAIYFTAGAATSAVVWALSMLGITVSATAAATLTTGIAIGIGAGFTILWGSERLTQLAQTCGIDPDSDECNVVATEVDIELLAIGASMFASFLLVKGGGFIRGNNGEIIGAERQGDVLRFYDINGKEQPNFMKNFRSALKRFGVKNVDAMTDVEVMRYVELKAAAEKLRIPKSEWTSNPQRVIEAIKNEMKLKGIRIEGLTDDEIILRYNQGLKPPIVPPEGDYVLTENDLRAYIQKNNLGDGLKTPDKIKVHNGKVSQIVQQYDPTSTEKTTIAQKVIDDVLKAISFNENAEKFGLEKNADLTIEMEVNENVPKDFGKTMLEYIRRMLIGEKNVLPAEYSSADLIRVRGMLEGNKVTFKGAGAATTPPPPTNGGGTTALVNAGLTEAQAKLIASDTRFKTITLDNDIDAPFATRPATGELIINAKLAAKFTQNAIKFGLEHEASEMAKVSLQTQGKILSNTQLHSKVNQIQLTESARTELFELIDERLIADKIALKNRPDLLQGWRDSADILLQNVDGAVARTQQSGTDWIYYIDNTDAFINELAYLKALKPDAAIVSKVEYLISNLPQTLKVRFDSILALMQQVIANV